jgi:hypothetical protein
MPLFDVECPAHHKNEVLLSSSEHRTLTADGPEFEVACPTEGCSERARRQTVSPFGATPVQWRRAAHDGSSQ